MTHSPPRNGPKADKLSLVLDSSIDHTVFRDFPKYSVLGFKALQSEMARHGGVRTAQIFPGVIIEKALPANPLLGINLTGAPKAITAVSSPQHAEPSISFTSRFDVARAIVAVATMDESQL